MKIIFAKSALLVAMIILVFSCNNNSARTSDQNEPAMDLVITDGEGNEISREELADATGTFNFELVGLEKSNPHSHELHAKARSFGQLGDYENAISKLKEAIIESPDWPYPYYDLAFTYLLQEDFENALKYYQITDRLAPDGFYTAKTALFTLEGEKKGDYTQGLYLAYMQFEWVESKEERIQLARNMTFRYPDFGPGWKELSNLLEGEERMKAIEKGLAAKSDLETDGILKINKAILMDAKGQSEAGKKMLLNIIFNETSTASNKELAKFALNSILG